jgi:ribosomal protein L37AE/L43A
MTLRELKESGHIIFEAISGSKAYGLDHAQSDTDIRGVYIAPKDMFYSLECPEQVNDATNDVVYYELRKFIELVSKNNPNIIELLNTPEDCVLYKHPIYDRILEFNWITKQCKNTFAGYAYAQIKKAKGLNKKVLNPMDKERKSVLDFCFVTYKNGAISLAKFLEIKDWKQEDCGLVNIPHMKDVFGLYYSDKGIYEGVLRSDKSNEVCLSSIPKGEEQKAVMSFNKDGYSSYCKDYREYWAWVEKRNDARYQNTIEHGKNYDAKNMMHTFRLLEMANEIAETGQVHVRRINREELLSIKAGNFTYDELVEKAKKLRNILEEGFANSSIKENLVSSEVNNLLVKIRSSFYGNRII